MRGDEVEVSLLRAQGETSETIVVETEKNMKIKLEDCNFDGHKDFSVSHLDDGMATYDVYQVYVYSVEQGKFIPLSPRYGDEL